MERGCGGFKLGPEKDFRTVIYSKSEAIFHGRVGKKKKKKDIGLFLLLFFTEYMFLKKG